MKIKCIFIIFFVKIWIKQYLIKSNQLDYKQDQLFSHMIMALINRQVDPRQKQKLDELKQQAISRLKPVQEAYNRDPSPQNLIETRLINDCQIPAYHFIIFITYTIRLLLFGVKKYKNDDTEGKADYETIKGNQVDRIYQQMKFIQQTFNFPKINLNNKPRINAFEIVKITKQFQQVFRNVKIVLKIQQVAKNLYTALENYLAENCHEKLKKCNIQERHKYIQPLYRMLEQVENNYPWNDWSKQYVMKELNQIKNQNKPKQLSQLNFLEILLISYARQEIKQFRLENSQSQKYLEDMFKTSKEQKDQKFRARQSEEPESNILEISDTKQKRKTIGDTPQISKNNNFMDEIKELNRLQQLLKEREKTSSGNKLGQKESRRLPRRVNEVIQRRNRNLEILDYHLKKEKNNKIVDKFLKVCNKMQDKQ